MAMPLMISSSSVRPALAAGAAYVVWRQCCSKISDLSDLSEARHRPRLRYYGDVPADGAGNLSRLVGMWNGDGFDDLIVARL
jgi:hypothetical protein